MNPTQQDSIKSPEDSGKVDEAQRRSTMMLLGGLLWFVLFPVQLSQAGPIQATTRSVQPDGQESAQRDSTLEVLITASTSNHTGVADSRPRDPKVQSRVSGLQRSGVQRPGVQRPVYEDFPSLKWVRWSGTLPRWAVRVKNERSQRFDYVCAPVTGCNWVAGSYNTGREALCRSTCHGEEQMSSMFDVLVNENNEAHLEWRNVTIDPYPPNAVLTSPSSNAVGRSPHGVGTVYVPFTQLYVPWHGRELVLQEDFEVLVMTGEYSQQIFDVLYHMDRMAVDSKTSVIVTMTSVTNNGNTALKKSVNLSKSVQQQSTWKTEDSLSISTSIKASIPFISVDIGFTFEKTFTTTKGNSVTETDVHSLTLEIDVPPRHVCRVKMVGEQYKANIPFTAKQLRVYDNGDERRTVITGVYYGTQVGEIKAVAERCLPADGEQPNYSY